jgi:hypothetical protein
MQNYSQQGEESRKAINDRHLKIGCTLETISFARGSRVEREFGREIGADMGKEKEGRKGRKQRENKVLTRLRNVANRRHRSLLRENKSGCARVGEVGRQTEEPIRGRWMPPSCRNAERKLNCVQI